MLVDPDFSAGAARRMDLRFKAERLQQGIYKAKWWNFELEFRGKQVYELDYPDLGDEFDSIGVVDSPEQLLSKLPKKVTEGPDKYVISMVEVRRDEQPEQGGWRWHKWGGYIGDKEPTQEYLRDELDIDVVWTYHVYAVE